ncbi:ribonuclease H-like domain-containing protein [Tanacetum coccineum]
MQSQINFFDNQISKSPYDEERATPNDEGNSRNLCNSPNAVRDESGNATSVGDKSILKGNSQHTQSVLVFSDQNDVNNEGVQPAGTRRSTKATKMPAKFNGYVVNSSLKAMNAEIEALNKNNTWTITDLPKGRKPIRCKWIFKIKYKASEEIERYMARLVAKVQNDWPLFQLDVNNAFLYSDLYEDQAPRQWNAKLVSALVDHGFVQSKYNDSLFVKDSGNTFMALLVYVDNIVITGSNVKQIDDFKQFLKSKFQIKDLGKLKYFLGIKVLENEKGGCLT